MLAEFVTSKFLYFIEVIAAYCLPPAYIRSQQEYEKERIKEEQKNEKEKDLIIERMQHLLFEMLKRLFKVQQI